MIQTKIPYPVRPAALAFCFLLAGSGLFAQPAGNSGVEAALPLRRVALFSSGVGFFEHSGAVSGPARLELPFNAAAVNDVLKSLVIAAPPAGPEGASPWVHYPSEETLYRTLRSLRIDLSGEPDLAAILRGQRGAEIETGAPNPIRGRILGVEHRALQAGPGFSGEWRNEPWLSLYTDQGIRGIALRDLGAFSFTDPQLNADLIRALDLIKGGRAQEFRELSVELPGAGTRPVSLGYVIPVPVWKVSYRLDLSGEAPLLQGWAIVDNDGDTDWQEVELSLVSGRPVSFIQNLYAPYHVDRPVLPLAIAGTARARTYDSGWGEEAVREAPQAAASLRSSRKEAAAANAVAESADYFTEAPSPAPRNLAGGAMETARGRALGDPGASSFEFTLPRPVSLARQQSAMLPLVEGTVRAERFLVFSEGSFTESAVEAHPAISVELTNTTGMRLPAGPITVFDGGTYGGDGLITFFPENEKRIISYGEDLSVSGSLSLSTTRTVSSVRLSRGIMTINRKLGYERVYSFRNAAAGEKRLILEHPITPGTELAEPAAYRERTGRVYRFAQTLPAGRELSLRVREESPASERITLTQLRLDSFLSYASNQEIPAEVRALLERAVELKRGADAAERDRGDREARRTRLISEQDRIRRNLEAAGNQSPQGQEYLKRLSAMDGEIDALAAELDRAAQAARTAQEAYETYLASLEI
jgi:hypothetical protein